jgi:signal transduction histidine kinase
MQANYRRGIYQGDQWLQQKFGRLPLQISLSLGVGFIIVLGIVSVVGWTSWEVHYMAIATQPNTPHLGADNRATWFTLGQKLYVVGTLITLGMIAAIALFIRFALSPLHRINWMANQIASTTQFQDLDTQLDFLPAELKGLVRVYRNAGTQIDNMQEQQQQLINNISHELRTPLTIIYGYLQSALRHGDNLTTTQREGLELATQETDRTIYLLQELLGIGRVDNRYDFDWEDLDLNELVQELVEMIRDSPVQPPSITFEPSKSAVMVRGDRMRLKQIILGLIDQAQSAILLELEQIGDRIILKICDRDRYIRPEMQARMFDRFSRIDTTRNSDADPSAFSLANVKALIEEMGGEIRIKSQLSKGSTFIITLPNLALAL